jgi:FkbM family methyltransferase
MTTRPLVYDVGMHNGDDSDYYLAKGFDVVGIDADATACEECEVRFAHEIASGRMTILNTGLAREAGTRDFFVSTTYRAMSSFEKPDDFDETWQTVAMPVRTLSSIIAERAPPHFIKIDVEHYDQLVLLDLMQHGIMPPYISSESHSLVVFCALVCMGYERFKLVEGYGIPDQFPDHPIALWEGGKSAYTFTKRSSGPFGEDIPGPWVDRDTMFEMLADHGMGWFDIHATTARS